MTEAKTAGNPKLPLHWKMAIGFGIGLLAGLIVYATGQSDAGWVQELTKYTTAAGKLFLNYNDGTGDIRIMDSTAFSDSVVEEGEIQEHATEAAHHGVAVTSGVVQVEHHHVTLPMTGKADA